MEGLLSMGPTPSSLIVPFPKIYFIPITKDVRIGKPNIDGLPVKAAPPGGPDDRHVGPGCCTGWRGRCSSRALSLPAAATWGSGLCQWFFHTARSLEHILVVILVSFTDLILTE